MLEALASLYPDAPIFTLFYDSSILPETLRHRQIIVHTGANRFRFMRKALLPFIPVWMESLPLEEYDFVISTSSCAAKGVMLAPHAKHMCYIHSPMRYIWDQRDEYLGRVRRLPVVGFWIEALSALLRLWDVTTSVRVNLFVANSRFVKSRVARYYGRDAVVVHPPIEVERFKPADTASIKKDYLLVAGAFVGYKRFDLAIQACEALGRKLVVAGSGPEYGTLKSLAGKNTTFVLSPSDAEWVSLLQGAKAFIFPGIEDFGMVAVEAMAAGTPVIALKAGGALDFVIDGTTGVYFKDPCVESLKEAIERSDGVSWSVDALIRHASGFSRESFIKGMRKHIEDLLSS